MGNKTQWTKLNWADPFELDSQLDDVQRMVQSSARDYAQSKLLPRVQSAFDDERMDAEIFREMGELGLLGSTISGYGCPGVDYICYGACRP